MRILFIGDVVGVPGRRILKSSLPRLVREHSPDLVVANSENVAGGSGVTPELAQELFRDGCDVLTSGNHIWDRKEVFPYLDSEERLLRPANYPDPAPGGGVCLLPARDGTPCAVINLMGRVFMSTLDDPFRTVDDILREIDGRASIVLVDFHAEATSEKVAFGWHLDGRVTAIVGTHTHVPTADERVLPGGTAYITDVGMTGPYDGVIGVEKGPVLARFRSQRPARFSPAAGDARLAAVLIEASPHTGRAEWIRRIEVREDKGDGGALPR